MPNLIRILLVAGAAAFVSSSTIRDASPPAKVAVVTVHAKDFSYVLPARIAAGPTTFRLVNDGRELHQVSLVKLAAGKSIADFREAMKKPGPESAWMTDVGGPSAAAPGAAIEATLTLDAGNYVLVCYIPSPGEPMPHMAKGMIASLTVVPAGSAGPASRAVAEAPVPDVSLALKDYGFAFSKPLTAGKHVIQVTNQGPQTHEVVFVKLAPGKHVADFTTWAGPGGMKGPPPAVPLDGMANLGAGRTAIFPANITPGTYALICFVPDAGDMKPHSAHGMTMEFEVK